ncbi:hypothetical protein BJI67_06905 [Acidihalobacter aeolianus]|uniref:ATP-grasp domain-containing protein n=1 Tax=Acidihalobacter aeolianus TaxID=2792603 RepID=A0A1D8K785_9GAMM|nr:hypothetical protein BJI67_06905 [Acidihalobacter aeolianus]
MVHEVPALVVGAGLNGLGVARSLHAAGVPVWIADIDATQPGMHSRCAKPLVLTGRQPLHLELEALVRGQAADHRPVLLLTQEHAVKALADHQDQLDRSYRFILPTPQILHALMHKPTFDQWARESGLRVPASYRVCSAVDVDEVLAAQPMPIVIKPSAHVSEFESQFRKAYRVETREEARKLLLEMLAVWPDLIVQEWVPGSDSDIYFCLQQLSETGQVEASFVGRKIRAWPPGTGGTASCAPAPVDDASILAERTTAFFSQRAVRGLAGMEYKRHKASGEYIAIEPTIGRTDYQEEIATLNGVNLPYACYLSAMGLHFSQSQEATPHKAFVWRDREADLLSLSRADQTARSWPAQGLAVKDALWRWADPGPWLARRRQRAWRKLKGMATHQPGLRDRKSHDA